MSQKDGWRELVRGALLDNLWLKVVSLIMALGFYGFIHGAENAQRILAVSVVSIMPDESANRQLMTQLPTEVAVTVRGSRTQLDDLRSDALGSLQLNLRSGRETRIELDPSMFHVPPGLVVEQIYPSAIELRWDDVVSKSIPVQVARAGEPADGFTVKGGISVEPTNVNARGARSIVDVLQFARAEPFDVTGLTEGTFRRPLALDRPPKQVTYDVETVTASVEIGRQLASREFDKLKVEVVGIPRATTLPARVKVTVTGVAEDVNAVLAEGIVPRVEPKTTGLDLAQPGSAYLDVLVDVPRVKVTIDPPKVLVKW